jgi:NTP pyrophosphatase (non-canonical NTP hydrolase)
MNENFINIGQPEDKLIEECSELIQAIIKAKRFGLFNINPLTNISNIDRIKSELADVEYAIEKYYEWLGEQ